MGVLISNLTSGGSSSAGTSWVTASVSPKALNLILLTVGIRNGSSVAPANPTVAGAGLTWVFINSTNYDTGGSSRRKVALFRAMNPSTTTGTVTITTGETDSDVTWVMDQASGVDITGTNGSGAVLQSAVNQNTAGGTSLTVTLGTFLDARNATYGAFANSDDAATSTPGTGFSAVGTGANTTNGVKTFTEYRTSNDTSVDMSWSGVGSELGGVAIEIKAANGNFFPFFRP